MLKQIEGNYFFFHFGHCLSFSFSVWFLVIFKLSYWLQQFFFQVVFFLCTRSMNLSKYSIQYSKYILPCHRQDMVQEILLLPLNFTPINLKAVLFCIMSGNAMRYFIFDTIAQYINMTSLLVNNWPLNTIKEQTIWSLLSQIQIFLE